MGDDDVPRIPISETGNSAPLTQVSSTIEATGTEGGYDVLPAERSELPTQFRGKVLRVIDDQLFVVDPGSPPAASTA